MAGNTPIPSTGSLSLSYLNQYLGANFNSQRMLSGLGSGQSMSLAQIFNSSTNTTNPATFTQQLNSLRGKTYGIYTNSMRTNLYGAFHEDPFGLWQGYFGFGQSGVLSTTNRGITLRHILQIDQGAPFEYSVQFYNASGQWVGIPLSSASTTITSSAYSAITVSYNSNFEGSLTLTSAPCMNGTTIGLGSHNLVLYFPPQGGGDSFPEP